MRAFFSPTQYANFGCGQFRTQDGHKVYATLVANSKTPETGWDDLTFVGEVERWEADCNAPASIRAMGDA